MVNENNKYVPQAPKTYIVAELKDQETKVTPLSTAQNKVIRRWGGGYRSSQAETDISGTVGYGPCSYCNPQCTCYVGSGYAPLHMSCPSCENRKLMVWTHHDNCCYGPMYISEYLSLECKSCYTSGHWKNWKFSCSEHKGYKYATSFMSFKDAVRMGLGMQAGNPGLADLVARISIKLIEEGRNQ